MGKLEINEILYYNKVNLLSAALGYLCKKYMNKIVFSTSLGYEDQVITDIIFKNNLPVEIFTLDTGRLFPETYEVLNKTNKKYKKNIHILFPDYSHIESMVTKKGPFSFYHSVENRRECCYIRKVEPLKRALKNKEAWITGLRKEQSEGRKNTAKFEWDAEYHLIKYNPLIDWTFEEVKKYIKENNVPYNILHDKGFLSIGCAPCTRAVKKGENFRDGRWWWENSNKKECGLHFNDEDNK